jgi:hypothetical protein
MQFPVFIQYRTVPLATPNCFATCPIVNIFDDEKLSMISTNGKKELQKIEHQKKYDFLYRLMRFSRQKIRSYLITIKLEYHVKSPELFPRFEAKL